MRRAPCASILLLVLNGLTQADQSFFELVQSGTPQEVEEAIRAGAKVNARTESGFTPLMSAAWANINPDVITTLLQAGADGKLKGKDGKTAFDHAKDNEALRGTAAYWALNDARF